MKFQNFWRQWLPSTPWIRWSISLNWCKINGKHTDQINKARFVAREWHQRPSSSGSIIKKKKVGFLKEWSNDKSSTYFFTFCHQMIQIQVIMSPQQLPFLVTRISRYRYRFLWSCLTTGLYWSCDRVTSDLSHQAQTFNKCGPVQLGHSGFFFFFNP